MLVLMPYCSADKSLADRLFSVVDRHVGRGHDLCRLHCCNSGKVEPLDFCVRPAAGPATCAQMIYGVFGRLFEDGWKSGTCRIGDAPTFLWLEPDCCPTSVCSLDRVEHAVRMALKKSPDVCVLGHDKRRQSPTLGHIAGPAVYRVTPELYRASLKFRRHVPHDMEIGEKFVGTDRAVHLDEIRCFWHYDTEPYLVEAYAGDPLAIYRANRDAAIIHGDRSGSILEHLWGAVQ